MDSQESGFAGQSRRLVAPTPSSAVFPSSEETARHPDWLHAFTILPPPGTAAATNLWWQACRVRHNSSFAASTAASTALSLIFGGEFVCGHALLASRRINYEAADFAVGGGFKCNSNRKLGSEEILLIFRADPEFR